MSAMSKVYDVLILGGGPAGYTAAMYAARAGLSTAVIERLNVGGQMALTDQIDNYPGMPEGIDGFTLGQAMKEGADRAGAESIFAEITAVELQGEIKTVHTDEGSFTAGALILATGTHHSHLGIEDEELLTGRGVHYCATCDAMFYRNKTVVVVGGGNSAVAAARVLSRLSKKVILVHRRDSLRAGKAEQASVPETVELRMNSRVTKLIHEGKLQAVMIADVNSGAEERIDCDGLFVSIGQSPNTQLFAGQLHLDEKGYLPVGEDTHTEIPGVFAAGDLRSKPLRQVITAAADGATAAHEAELYLSQSK